MAHDATVVLKYLALLSFIHAQYCYIYIEIHGIMHYLCSITEVIFRLQMCSYEWTRIAWHPAAIWLRYVTYAILEHRQDASLFYKTNKKNTTPYYLTYNWGCIIMILPKEIHCIILSCFIFLSLPSVVIYFIIFSGSAAQRGLWPPCHTRFLDHIRHAAVRITKVVCCRIR
jgi:hypothetical protein